MVYLFLPLSARTWTFFSSGGAGLHLGNKEISKRDVRRTDMINKNTQTNKHIQLCE